MCTYVESLSEICCVNVCLYRKHEQKNVYYYVYQLTCTHEQRECAHRSKRWVNFSVSGYMFVRVNACTCVFTCDTRANICVFVFTGKHMCVFGYKPVFVCVHVHLYPINEQIRV